MICRCFVLAFCAVSGWVWNDALAEACPYRASGFEFVHAAFEVGYIPSSAECKSDSRQSGSWQTGCTWGDPKNRLGARYKISAVMTEMGNIMGKLVSGL